MTDYVCSQNELNKIDKIAELLEKIRGWAEDRNLIKGSAPINQLAKLIEEAGEVATEVNNLNLVDLMSKDEVLVASENLNDLLNRLKDGIGDTVVVATILAAQYVEKDSNSVQLNPAYLVQDEYLDGLNLDFYGKRIDFNNLTSSENYVIFANQLLSPTSYITECLGNIAGQVARGKLLEDGTEKHQYLGALCFWLAYLAYATKLDIVECIENAWNEIKDRKGRMENGVFIKEAD